MAEVVAAAEAAGKLSNTPGHGWKIMTLASRWAAQFDALVCCMEMVRWRGEFAGLKATRDEVLRLEGITWRPGVSA